MRLRETKDKDEKQHIETDVDAAASIIAEDGWSRKHRGHHVKNSDSYGLCAGCVYFQSSETDFMTLIARCREFDLLLHEERKVARCTEYEERGIMTLNAMKEIAWLIDDNKKEPVGFKKRENEP